MSTEIKPFKEYSTDGKVRHYTTEDDINVKLGNILEEEKAIAKKLRAHIKIDQ
jgi:hypothetical protein